MNKTQIVLLSILTFSLLAYKISQPFWGHHEFNGVFYGMIAKNYLRYGLLETKGGQVTNLYPAVKTEWNFHTHHPATYPTSLAVLFKIFGSHEYVVRLFSIATSVFGIYFLAKLLILVFDYKFAWLAVIPILFTPLFRYYGSLPVFEPILFPLIVLGFYLYWKNQKSKQFTSLIVVCVIAMLVDWPGFWLPIWLIILELVTQKRKELIKTLLFSLIGSFSVILVLQLIATGSLSDLLKVGRYRLQAAPYTTYGWIRLLLARTRAFLGLVVVISAVLGFIVQMKNVKSSRFLLILVSLGLGLSHIFVFRNITWYHDYMLYHLLPFLGLALGSLLDFVFRRTKSHMVVVALVILISTFTFTGTKRFLVDLSAMKGHKDCIDMGRLVRKSPEKLTFTLNSEKAKECPPFIGFYGEKPFEIEIKE